MTSDPISVAIPVSAEPDSAAPVGARPFASAQDEHAVPLHNSGELHAPVRTEAFNVKVEPAPRVTAMAAPLALPLPKRKPWTLPASGLAVFYGRPETPRLFHYFLPRLLSEGKQVLCLDGANRFDPLLIARLARQRGREVAEFNRRIRVARAFTCFQLTELLVRVPRLLDKFAAAALVVTALPDRYFDEDVRESDAGVAFRHALDALRPLPLGVAVFSDATSFETPRRAMFRQLAAQATELWRFALDGEGGKLRLIGEEGGSRLQVMSRL